MDPIEIKKLNNQSGVTLLLSVLILSSVLAISMSLATILFVEIRASGDLIRTEPAIYAASAVSEQALFKIRRASSALGGCTDSNYASQIGPVAIPIPCESYISDSVQVIKVPASSNTFANSVVHVPIYTDPSNPASGYGKIEISYPTQAATDDLSVYVCEFDMTTTVLGDVQPPCSNSASTNSYWAPTSAAFSGTIPGTLSPGTVSKTVILDPTKQQELILVNSAGTQDIYTQITTYDSGGLAKGVPYGGQVGVNITANSSNISRKIKVISPINTTSVSGGGNSASFVKIDSSTQGSWHGVYGADGYNIIGATASSPAYVTLTASGNLFYSWADPTADVRGLYKDSVTSTRLADTWYSSTSETLDFNITDGFTHQVAVYILDWDSTARIMTIDALDGATSAVLDTQSASNFNGGKYFVWNISGHVQLRFTKTSGANSVISGIFFN